MFRDIEVTPEDEEEMIGKAAEMIHKRGMETAAIFMLETVKPLTFIGGQMARYFIQPILIIFGDYARSEKFLTIFEKRKNVEKLIKLLEEKGKEEESEKDRESERETTEAHPKKGWRRFLPF